MQFLRSIKLILKKTIYQLNVVLVKFTQPSRYSISRGYIHRKDNYHFDDTQNTDMWQKEVYQKAKEIMVENNFTSIIDFGCGSGFKLIKYLSEYETTGIEISPTYEFLTKKYSNKTWINFTDIKTRTFTSDVVICSDVIEHVPNPDDLIHNISQITNSKYIIISTPDRDLVKQPKFGPPLNKTHMREWNFKEFKEYIGKHFEIIDHYISNKKQATQLIIVKKKVIT